MTVKELSSGMIRAYEFERYTTQGFFTKLHAISKIVFLTLVSITMILIQQTEMLLFLNIIILILFLFSTLSLRLKLIGLGVVLLSSYSLMISQSLFYNLQPRTLLYSFGQINLGLIDIKLDFWIEGFYYGLKSSLRLTAPFLLSYLLFFTSSAHEILEALKRMRLNEAFSIMLLTALRFIPFIFENYQIIRSSEKLKGYRFSFITLFKSINAEMKMIIPVFFMAIRNSRLVAIAMIGRQFDLNHKKKTLPLKLAQRDKIFLSISISLFTLIFMIKTMYWLYIYDFFYSDLLRPLYAFSRNFL